MINKTDIEFEIGSGNIFADLGLENAEELHRRARIGSHVVKLLKGRNMNQRDLSILIGIKQAEVSHLMNGHFERFSTDKLLDFLEHLNYKVDIQISPRQNGEPYQSVAFAV